MFAFFWELNNCSFSSLAQMVP